MRTDRYFLSLWSLIVVTVALAAASRGAFALQPGTGGQRPLLAMDTDVISNVRDGVVCFTLFIGGVAGIAGIFLRRKLAGILFFLACGFFAIDPISEVVIFRIVTPKSGGNYDDLMLAYSVISAIAIVLGMGCFIGALYTAKPKPRVPQPGFPVEPGA